MSVVDPQAVGFLHGTDRLSQTLAVRLYRGQHHSDTPVLAPPPTHSQVLASDAIEVSILEGDRESRPIPCFREPDGVVSWDAALKPGRYSYRLRLACGLDTRPTDGSRAAPLKKAAIIHTDLSRVFTLEVVGCPAGHISDCPLCLTVRVNVLVHADHYVCRACLENWARSCLQVSEEV